MGANDFVPSAVGSDGDHSSSCVARSASLTKTAWNPSGTLAGSLTVATGFAFMVFASHTRSSERINHGRGGDGKGSALGILGRNKLLLF